MNYAAARGRAHVLLCTLACYVEWHMRQRLKPLLFDGEEPERALGRLAGNDRLRRVPGGGATAQA